VFQAGGQAQPHQQKESKSGYGTFEFLESHDPRIARPWRPND
jgi:hypothetical protein